MIKIYGIKNCNTMQKAFKLLGEAMVKYDFHDYKASGIDQKTLKLWLDHLPLDKVVNTQSTTYRALSDSDKAGIGDKATAIALMIRNPSLIKRPVWDFGRGEFYLGYDEDVLKERIAVYRGGL